MIERIKETLALYERQGLIEKPYRIDINKDEKTVYVELYETGYPEPYKFTVSNNDLCTK